MASSVRGEVCTRRGIDGQKGCGGIPPQYGVSTIIIPSSEDKAYIKSPQYGMVIKGAGNIFELMKEALEGGYEVRICYTKNDV